MSKICPQGYKTCKGVDCRWYTLDYSPEKKEVVGVCSADGAADRLSISGEPAMGDFSMTEYYHQYMTACQERDRAKLRVEARKDSSCFLLSVENEEDYEQWKADVAAAEAELKAAQDEVERLYYLSTYGKTKDEITPEPEGAFFIRGEINKRHPPSAYNTPPKSLIPKFPWEQ